MTMLIKSVLIAGILTLLTSMPFVLTGMFDMSVRMSVGPVAAVFEPDQDIDIDLNAECMSKGCPVMAIEIGEGIRLGL